MPVPFFCSRSSDNAFAYPPGDEQYYQREYSAAPPVFRMRAERAGLPFYPVIHRAYKA